MKRISLTSFFLLLMIFCTVAQAPDASGGNEAQLLALVKEVQAQQLQITANQTKIDAKLAEVAETIRVARIFSSRAR